LFTSPAGRDGAGASWRPVEPAGGQSSQRLVGLEMGHGLERINGGLLRIHVNRYRIIRRVRRCEKLLSRNVHSKSVTSHAIFVAICSGERRSGKHQTWNVRRKLQPGSGPTTSFAINEVVVLSWPDASLCDLMRRPKAEIGWARSMVAVLTFARCWNPDGKYEPWLVRSRLYGGLRHVYCQTLKIAHRYSSAAS
jgi:hypothetical protein